jgi:phytoene dehydrogenase-like protein
MGAVAKAMKWKEPSPGVSLKEWIRQYSSHTGIREVFQTLVASMLLVNIDEIEARDFFAFMKTLKGVQQFGYAPMGNISLPATLTDSIHQYGGKIWTRAAVKRIFLEDGLVRGAMVARNGKEIPVYASAVISNAGPLRTAHLVGRENLDSDYLGELDSTLIPTKMVCLQVAVDQPLIEQNHLLVTGARRINAIYQPTRVCPQWAPEGKHLLIASAVLATSSAPLDADKEIGMCLEDLQDLFPGFRKHSEILLAGIYRNEWPGMHAGPGHDMPRKTPIINLYNVGDGVKSSGYTGLPAVVHSGITVAEEIRQRVNLLKISAADATAKIDDDGLHSSLADYG